MFAEHVVHGESLCVRFHRSAGVSVVLCVKKGPVAETLN